MTLRTARILKAAPGEPSPTGIAGINTKSGATRASSSPPVGGPTAALSGAPARPPRIVPRHEQDSISRAHGRIESASREADAILARARDEAAALVDAARADGRTAGASELAAAWIRLREAQDAVDRTHEDHALVIARVLAERLIERELGLSPSTIVDLSREVLRALARARSLKLYVHPDDAPALEAHRTQLSIATTSVEILADPQRTRGSLRAESDLGTLDADLSPRLDLLVDALRAR